MLSVFHFFLGAFLGFLCILLLGFALLEINSYLSKKRWESVCLPKEEGGLGPRRVKDSNDASVMKHIWNLLYRKDFLSVAWVQKIYLRQGSLWCAKIPSNCSWSWRKILQLRDRIRPFFFFFFWINKNLFPKGQSPTKNTHEVKKDPKKMKKRTAPPLKQRKWGISPKQKYT